MPNVCVWTLNARFLIARLDLQVARDATGSERELLCISQTATRATAEPLHLAVLKEKKQESFGRFLPFFSLNRLGIPTATSPRSLHVGTSDIPGEWLSHARRISKFTRLRQARKVGHSLKFYLAFACLRYTVGHLLVSPAVPFHPNSFGGVNSRRSADRPDGSAPHSIPVSHG